MALALKISESFTTENIRKGSLKSHFMMNPLANKAIEQLERHRYKVFKKNKTEKYLSAP